MGVGVFSVLIMHVASENHISGVLAYMFLCLISKLEKVFKCNMH